MRQRLSERSTRRLAVKLQLPIVKVLVRGGTNHRKDLFLQDGTILHYWPDGEFTANTLVSVSRVWDGTWEAISQGKDPSIPDECRE